MKLAIYLVNLVNQCELTLFYALPFAKFEYYHGGPHFLFKLYHVGKARLSGQYSTDAELSKCFSEVMSLGRLKELGTRETLPNDGW